MLNLIDTLRPRSPHTDADTFASQHLAAPRLAPRPRAYAGPERRSVASLSHRRMAQMLDAIDYGMLLMADEHHVAHANKAARRDLDAQHPLQLVGDELQVRSALDAVPLREAMQGAAQRGLRRLLHLGPPSPDGRARVSVAVVPLAAIGNEQAQGVALLLGKRQVCEELTVDWFARTHGLTMAETTVMKGLCSDLTPQQIAARQGVGLATVRTQIGAIRHKTGAGSIRALVREVALLPPLVSALQSANGSAAPLPGAGSTAPAPARPALRPAAMADRWLHA
jgi:DNA-binding CsgD family transcriptional regulator